MAKQRISNIEQGISNVEVKRRRAAEALVPSKAGSSQAGKVVDRQFDLEERLISFAVRVLDVVEALPRSRVGVHLAAQLVRAGTAPAANYGEAQSAESRADFVHKMKVALKELRETRVWLLTIQRKELTGKPERMQSIVAECNELISIFVACIATAQKNMRR